LISQCFVASSAAVEDFHFVAVVADRYWHQSKHAQLLETGISYTLLAVLYQLCKHGAPYL
jgi:hypothetical protein